MFEVWVVLLGCIMRFSVGYLLVLPVLFCVVFGLCVVRIVRFDLLGFVVCGLRFGGGFRFV